jgi:LPXTG-motif cell wall-anchored protein
MVQTTLATKALLFVLPLLISFSAIAGGGDDHAHGPGEGDHGMQILGILIIVVLASAVIWFLSKKKK